MTENTSRKLAAIMFADIVSYSRLMGGNEGEALKLLKDFENISAKIVREYEGVIIKKNGDQIFCEFTSAKNAVDASLKIQKELSKYNDSRPKDFKLEVRIGIHIGDVVKREDGDIHGDGVNVAARIQPLASPGGICVSGAVSDAISSHPDYDVISKGEQELKNILQKHSIFQVKTGYESIEPQSNRQSSINTRPNLYLYLIIAIMVIGGVLFYFKDPQDPISDNIANSSTAKRLTIAHITSNSANIDYAMEKSNVKLMVLSKTERNNIYDELITLLKNNYNSTDINYYTKYQLKEDSNKKGHKTRQYTFKYVQMKYNGINDMLEVHKMAMEDENSLFNYRENTLSDFTYFPMIYKINDLVKKNEYFIFHTLTYIKEIIKDSDTTRMYYDPVIYKTVNEEDILEEMSEFILKQYRSYIMINNGIIIEILDDNKILFKYDKTKNNIEKRMVFDAIRNYKYKVNTDDFDEFVTSRIDDLINYEYYVDQNPESIFYKNYYNLKGPRNNFVGLTNFTKDELTSLLNRTHPFYDYEGQYGMSYGFPIAIDIKIKIEEVYDSTATASIYKSEDPNIKLRVGDIVKY